MLKTYHVTKNGITRSVVAKDRKEAAEIAGVPLSSVTEATQPYAESIGGDINIIKNKNNRGS